MRGPKEEPLSENITHTAIVDDCARLALSAPRICAAFKGGRAWRVNGPSTSIRVNAYLSFPLHRDDPIFVLLHHQRLINDQAAVPV